MRVELGPADGAGGGGESGSGGRKGAVCRPQVRGASREGDCSDAGSGRVGGAPDKPHAPATAQVASENGNASQGLSAVHKVRCFHGDASSTCYSCIL